MIVDLLRHGATSYTTDGRYQGTHDVPLSPEGRASLHRADFSPDLVYCSPQRRALESAAILFPAARLEPIEDLREMNFGIFEGRSPAQMEGDPDYRAWVEGGCLGPIPGGDTKDAFQARVTAAFARLVDQALAQGRQRLTILAHGGVQMAVMEQYALPRRPFWEWCGPLGGGFLLDAGGWTEDHTLTLVRRVCYAGA